MNIGIACNRICAGLNQIISDSLNAGKKAVVFSINGVEKTIAFIDKQRADLGQFIKITQLAQISLQLYSIQKHYQALPKIVPVLEDTLDVVFFWSWLNIPYNFIFSYQADSIDRKELLSTTQTQIASVLEITPNSDTEKLATIVLEQAVFKDGAGYRNKDHVKTVIVDVLIDFGFWTHTPVLMTPASLASLAKRTGIKEIHLRAAYEKCVEVQQASLTTVNLGKFSAISKLSFKAGLIVNKSWLLNRLATKSYMVVDAISVPFYLQHWQLVDLHKWSNQIGVTKAFNYVVSHLRVGQVFDYSRISFGDVVLGSLLVSHTLKFFHACNQVVFDPQEQNRLRARYEMIEFGSECVYTGIKFVNLDARLKLGIEGAARITSILVNLCKPELVFNAPVA